jgi:hypothetical protein
MELKVKKSQITFGKRPFVNIFILVLYPNILHHYIGK